MQNILLGYCEDPTYYQTKTPSLQWQSSSEDCVKSTGGPWRESELSLHHVLESEDSFVKCQVNSDHSVYHGAEELENWC